VGKAAQLITCANFLITKSGNFSVPYTDPACFVDAAFLDFTYLAWEPVIAKHQLTSEVQELQRKLCLYSDITLLNNQISKTAFVDHYENFRIQKLTFDIQTRIVSSFIENSLSENAFSIVFIRTHTF